MATQIISVLCEGPHDVAFICRILKTMGFSSAEKTKLGNYPPPMNALLQKEAQQVNIEDLNLTELRRTLLPSNVLSAKDVMIFLYSIGGDGKVKERKKILEDFSSFIPADGEIFNDRLPENTELGLVYFFDADQKGVSQRINEVNSELQSVLKEVESDVFERNSEVKIISKLKLGCYVFSEDSETGKLEDILIPLMKQGNEIIFDNATGYLDQHYNESRLFPLKISINDGKVKETRSDRGKDKVKYDKYKSLLGVVGQLQSSGKSNVVCISDSDYLTIEKISSNQKCREIKDFFSQFINFKKE